MSKSIKRYQYKAGEKKDSYYKNIMDDVHASSVNSANVINIVKDENIIIVMGNTRAGKSTLVNYIKGNKLTAIEDEDCFETVVVKADSTAGPAIGIGPIAETTIPTMWKCDLVKEHIWDAPGFGDNRSVVQDISNAFYIKHLLNHARSVKFILVSDFHDIFSGNVQNFTDLIKTVHRILPNVEELEESISIIFTKVELGFNTDKICHILRRKIIKEAAINIDVKERNLLQHFVNNPESIGIFGKIKAEGPLPALTEHSSIIQAINTAKSAPQSMLHDIAPGISPASEIFLLKNYKAICDSEDLDVILQEVKKLYISKIQSIINVLTKQNISKLEISTAAAGIQNISAKIQQLSKGSEKGIDVTIKTLNSWHPMIEQKVIGSDLLTKIGFTKFIDKLLQIDQSQIFVLKFSKMLAEIEQKLGNANVRVELKLENINQAEAEKQDIILEQACSKKAKELEKAMADLEEANAAVAMIGLSWFDEATIFSAEIAPSLAEIVSGAVAVRTQGIAALPSLITNLNTAIKKGMDSIEKARADIKLKRAEAELKVAEIESKIAELKAPNVNQGDEPNEELPAVYIHTVSEEASFLDPQNIENVSLHNVEILGNAGQSVPYDLD